MRSRLLTAIMVSSGDRCWSLQFISNNTATKKCVVAMKPTKDYDPQSSPLFSYDFLKSKLASKDHHFRNFLPVPYAQAT